jgi:hypothetical protein
MLILARCLSKYFSNLRQAYTVKLWFHSTPIGLYYIKVVLKKILIHTYTHTKSSLPQLHLIEHKGPQLHQNSEHKALPWLLVKLHTEKFVRNRNSVKQSNAHHTTNLKHFLVHIFILLVSTVTPKCWARRMEGAEISLSHRGQAIQYTNTFIHIKRTQQ